MGVSRSDIDDGSMTYHVIPCGDLREHVEHGHDCWCKPALDYVENNGLLCGWIVIHNAADGREQYETGERKHQ